MDKHLFFIFLKLFFFATKIQGYCVKKNLKLNVSN